MYQLTIKPTLLVRAGLGWGGVWCKGGWEEYTDGILQRMLYTVRVTSLLPHSFLISVAQRGELHFFLFTTPHPRTINGLWKYELVRALAPPSVRHIPVQSKAEHHIYMNETRKLYTLVQD
jgi:hypothetical protein